MVPQATPTKHNSQQVSDECVKKKKKKNEKNRKQRDIKRL